MAATRITERISLGGTKIDREGHVIRDVKILGETSGNNRIYPRKTMEEARGLYEGAKVNIDHASGNSESRSYADRFGSVVNVRVSESGMLGDLTYNPKHRLAEQFLWDAEHAPGNVGLSHCVDGITSVKSGKTIVEQITRVLSVDVVANPATNKTLFEDQSMDGEPPVGGSGDPMRDMIHSLVNELWGATDQAAALKKLNQTWKGLKKLTDAGDGGGEPAADAAATESLRQANAALKEQLDRLLAEKAIAAKREAIEKQISESGLPAEFVTDVLRESLLSAPDEAARTKLIAERQAIAKKFGVVKPVSREQRLGGDPSIYESMDAKQFADALRE